MCPASAAPRNAAADPAGLLCLCLGNEGELNTSAGMCASRFVYQSLIFLLPDECFRALSSASTCRVVGRSCVSGVRLLSAKRQKCNFLHTQLNELERCICRQTTASSRSSNGQGGENRGDY